MISKKGWQWFFRLTVAVISLMILAFHVGKLQDLGRAFSDIRYSLVVAAVCLMVLNIYVQYRKWLYILRLNYPSVSRLETLGSILAGFTMGLITPGRIGELGRGLYLRHVDKWQVTGLTLVDKISNNLVIFFAGTLAFYYLFKYPFNLSIYILAPFTVIIILVWFILIRLAAKPQVIYYKLLALKVRFKRLQQFASVMDALKNLHSHHVGIIFGYSILFYGLILTQFLLLVEAFAPRPILPTLAALIAAMFSQTLLPISFGDLGIREGAAVYFLYQVGVVKVYAFDAALMLFAINILLPSIIGIFLIPRLSLFNNDSAESNVL